MPPVALADAIFSFFCPSVAITGPGSSREAAAQAKMLGSTHILLITDTVLSQLGMVQPMAAQFESAGLRVTVFDGVEPNPTDANVHAAAELYRQNQCDALVSFGGGSAHDCAKGAGIVISNGGDILSYAGMGTVKKPLPPLIAINTTAGTGSEATRAAVITNAANHDKVAIVDPRITPRVAINDPRLMLSMPPSLTASTALDALSHAVETYVSTASTPITDALAVGAIKLIGQWLRPAYANGANLLARDRMAYAEYMAGMAFSNGRLGCVHAIASPLAAICDLPHGVCCALLLPAVCEYNLIAEPERFAEIAAALGEHVAGLSVGEAAVRAPIAIRKLNRDVGMPANLAEAGVKATDLEAMARESVPSIAARTNPRTVNFPQMLGILQSAMGVPLVNAAAR